MVARPHLMPFFNESKKEPVQIQQFLIKRECDSEVGLTNSFIVAIET